MIAGLLSLGLGGAFAKNLHARQGAGMGCSAVEVRSVIGLTEIASRANHFLNAAVPLIEAESQKRPSAEGSQEPRAVKVIVLGPVLGSMDSRNVKTHVTCDIKGFVLVATITRSANYTGSAAQDILWRPNIEISAILRQRGAVCEAVWKMRLTNGTWVDRSRPRAFPDYQRYPFTLTKVIH